MRPAKPPTPPASAPWAMTMSTPSSAATRACSTVWTCAMTSAPASWTREARSPGRPCEIEMARGPAASAQSRHSGWSCSHGRVKFTMKGREVMARNSLQLGAEVIGCALGSADRADGPGIRDRGGQCGAAAERPHPGLDDGVLDAQQCEERSAQHVHLRRG